MDGLQLWICLKIGFSILALIVCIISFMVAVRVRGIWQWERSLGLEMDTLEQATANACGPRHLAISRVLAECTAIKKSRSPDTRLILHLDDYLRHIAACYHPDTDQPELCLTLGQALKAATQLVDRLERIIQRQGLRRFAWVRIRHIRKAYAWYVRVYQHTLWGWVLRNQNVISRVMYIKRIILPDPFSWLAYFSNRFTILILTRTLILDLYLFVGKLALDAYDSQMTQRDTPFSQDYLAETLAELYDSKIFNEWQSDPQVAEIRNRLVGAPKRILLPPTFGEWKASIVQVANIIATRHFPQSEAPLEEAALGPIILQSQVVLRSIGEMSHYLGIKQLLTIELGAIYNAQNFTRSISTWGVTGVAQKALGGYRKIRWPLKIYRWIKRSSPGGIAMDLGMETLRKTLINYLARFTFDRTCHEIEGLYRNSKNNGPKEMNETANEIKIELDDKVSDRERR